LRPPLRIILVIDPRLGRGVKSARGEVGIFPAAGDADADADADRRYRIMVWWPDGEIRGTLRSGH
jgi:hypothetical protein